MRNLIKVIDEIVVLAPELDVYFKSLVDTIRYSAPECMNANWVRAANILNTHARDHFRKEEIAKVFSGE